MRHLPIIFAAIASLLTLLLVAPVAIAVALLRSSSDAQGPSLVAQISIALMVVALVSGAGLLVWRVTRFLVRRSSRG